MDSAADGAQQTTVRIRSGQWQGFAIGIFNTSNFTETIIGPPTGLDVPWDSPNGGPRQPRIEVSAPDRAIANGGFIRTDVIPLGTAVALAGPSHASITGPGPITAPASETLDGMDPVRALRQIAFQLERAGAPTYRVRAFRRAAQVADDMAPGELAQCAGRGTLQELAGIGPATAEVISQAAAGQEPEYLRRLLDSAEQPPRTAMRAALRGDCHAHSDWSDGGSPPDEMAEAAIALGHEWMALTDHSPRLTVANGLSAARLEAQLELVGRLNAELAPFRILTGIEVDILEDGGVDQREDLLAELDVVVASVHSKLRMPGAEMTPRMVAAISNPHVDVLGHCTGRMVLGRGRPQSEFDPAAVFSACREQGVAVEINCRPERQDPPDDLLALAVAAGCVFAIDTDAHAPGQLDWLDNGCERAERAGIPPDRVINTRSADMLGGPRGGEGRRV